MAVLLDAVLSVTTGLARDEWPLATVAHKVMRSGKMAGQATAAFFADPTQAKRAGPDQRAGPKASVERNDGSLPGVRRRRWLDAQHDSATGHVPLAGEVQSAL